MVCQIRKLPTPSPPYQKQFAPFPGFERRQEADFPRKSARKLWSEFAYKLSPESLAPADHKMHWLGVTEDDHLVAIFDSGESAAFYFRQECSAANAMVDVAQAAPDDTTPARRLRVKQMRKEAVSVD